MREALHECGVFVLSPSRQATTAASLAGAGLDGSDVLLLRRFVSETEKDPAQVRRYLAGLLADPQNAAQAVRNLKDYRMKNPEQDDKDYEFGSRDRQGTLQRIQDHDRVWEAEVAQRKLEGRWPPSKYRDPHPWENGVVQPPKEEVQPRAVFDPKKPGRERLTHLIACIKALKADKRPIPGHMLSEMVWLKAHWDGFDIPPEAIEARRALERS